MERLRRVPLLALVFACVLGLGTSVSAQGIGSRPKPAEFKGTNYFPSTTLGISNALNMLTANNVSLDGAFSATQTYAEISQIEKARVNCIRIFPSFYGWLVNPADYMANLKTLAKACVQNRIVITFVMWNTTSNVFVPLYLAVDPNTVSYDANLHMTIQNVASTYTLSVSNVPYQTVLSFGEPWQMVLHDFPGNSLFEAPYNGVMSTWPNNLQQKCQDYVDAIGNFFATDPDGKRAFGSYDLFNENDCCNLIFAQQMELFRMTYQRLQLAHQTPGAPFPEMTVGFANNAMTLQNYNTLVQNGVKQTYLSFHCYDAQPSFGQVVAQNAAMGQQLGLPVVCSEFYDRNKAGHLGNLGSFINDLETHDVAGQVWGVLATNLIIPDPLAPPGTFIRFDGMIIPSAIPFTSFTSPVVFLLAPGAQAVQDYMSVLNW